jgi:hypothetical protein
VLASATGTNSSARVPLTKSVAAHNAAKGQPLPQPGGAALLGQQDMFSDMSETAGPAAFASPMEDCATDMPIGISIVKAIVDRAIGANKRPATARKPIRRLRVARTRIF